jgi:hypothetical protein
MTIKKFASLNVFAKDPALNMNLDLIPSDVAAQTICDVLASPSPERFVVYNMVNPHPVS